MEKTKGIYFLLFVCAIGIAIATVVSAGGKVYSTKIKDRVKFTFTEESYENGVYECTLTAKKNDATFYAVLHSIGVSGIEADKIEITPLTGATTTTEIILDDSTFSWNIKIYFNANAEIENPELEILYTAGVKYESAVKKILRIPLTIDK